MDADTLVIEFATQPQAIMAKFMLDAAYVAWCKSQGYTVIAGEVVPKNLATGEDMFEAQRTKQWDGATLTTEGKYILSVPTGEFGLSADALIKARNYLVKTRLFESVKVTAASA